MSMSNVIIDLTQEDSDNENDQVLQRGQEVVCEHCGCLECVWDQFSIEEGNLLFDLKDRFDSGERPGEIRKTAFRHVTFWLNGPMKRGQRKRLPKCVETNVRKLFPSPNGRYMGFRPR